MVEGCQAGGLGRLLQYMREYNAESQTGQKKVKFYIVKTICFDHLVIIYLWRILSLLSLIYILHYCRVAPDMQMDNWELFVLNIQSFTGIGWQDSGNRKRLRQDKKQNLLIQRPEMYIQYPNRTDTRFLE